MPMDIASLEIEMNGMCVFWRAGFSNLTAAAPPIADARTAANVIPT